MNKKDVLFLLSQIKNHKDRWEIRRFSRLIEELLYEADSETADIISRLIRTGKLNTVACALENYISRATVYRRIEGFCRLVIYSSRLSGDERIFLRCIASLRKNL